jgi:hypothetical protein
MADLPTLCTLDPRLEREIAKRIPESCREGLLNYLRHGIPPGLFLRAVLENNLLQAYCRADELNWNVLAAYMVVLVNYAPSVAWSSPRAVSEWIAKGANARAAADRELSGPEAAQALGTFVAGKVEGR